MSSGLSVIAPVETVPLDVDYRFDCMYTNPVIEYRGGCYLCRQGNYCVFHHNSEGFEGCFKETFYLSWGDCCYYEELVKEARMTEDERKVEEARKAKEEEERELAEEARRMAAYAQEISIKSRCKSEKGHKHDEPCKNLYYDEHAPKYEWVRDKKGKPCAPLRRGLTNSECWAWVYTDPKTKKRVEVHTCQYQHPGEEGWRKEWDTDRNFRPQTGETRFASLTSTPKQKNTWQNTKTSGW